jgi:hypothetical protein
MASNADEQQNRATTTTTATISANGNFRNDTNVNTFNIVENENFVFVKKYC